MMKLYELEKRNAMTYSKRFYSTKLIALFFTLSLVVTACGDKEADTASTASTQTSIHLSDANLKAFQATLFQDYTEFRNKLINNFKKFKKLDDSHQFTLYRNNTWTPAYIKKKTYYKKILNENSAYIEGKPIEELFLRFENLHVIGVNLKRGFINDNEHLLKSTYNQIKADHAKVKQFKQ